MSINVLKNKEDECWFDEYIKILEDKGNAYKSVQEWMDAKFEEDRQAED